ncbi:MAG: energy-coupled thiamine transporter ThiT [Oscillospiraceae bacterium]|nr:energy-coupled thiamine transporter ThiT [Oscillospiraceae bacterium]
MENERDKVTEPRTAPGTETAPETAVQARPAQKKRRTLRIMVEGGVCIALAIALSYLKIPIGLEFGGFGGSIDLVMIPLIFFAMRSNAGWGIGAGLIFGLLKFFFAGGSAINWQSMLLDYVVAYGMVGLAGLFHKHYKLLPVAAVVGCLGRFAVHYLSGVTIYKISGLEKILNVETASPSLYSLLYNGTYMLPNTILAVVVCCLLLAMPQLLRRPE